MRMLAAADAPLLPHASRPHARPALPPRTLHPLAAACLLALTVAQSQAPPPGAAADGGAAPPPLGNGGRVEISSSIVLAVPTDYLLDGSGRSKCMEMVERWEAVGWQSCSGGRHPAWLACRPSLGWRGWQQQQQQQQC